MNNLETLKPANEWKWHKQKQCDKVYNGSWQSHRFRSNDRLVKLVEKRISAYSKGFLLFKISLPDKLAFINVSLSLGRVVKVKYEAITDMTIEIVKAGCSSLT